MLSLLLRLGMHWIEFSNRQENWNLFHNNLLILVIHLKKGSLSITLRVKGGSKRFQQESRDQIGTNREDTPTHNF